MNTPITGIILKCVGGLYDVQPDDGSAVLPCRARGAIRHEKRKTLIGDHVRVTVGADGSCAIEEILPRKNALIRPPLANLDILFVAIAAAQPMPSLTLADKLISIAEFSKVQPVIVVTKHDLDAQSAAHIAALYQKVGFPVFVTASAVHRTKQSRDAETAQDDGIAALKAWIAQHCFGKISTVAGVSGAGKSTLLNTLFPTLALETGGLSQRIERGKNTTRHTELFPLSVLLGCQAPNGEEGYLADTPGFSLIDFTRFDFYGKEDLPYTFREFVPYLGKCRYTKCTHTKEDGCAILEAVKSGAIPPERHASFTEIYRDLKDKHAWDNR